MADVSILIVWLNVDKIKKQQMDNANVYLLSIESMEFVLLALKNQLSMVKNVFAFEAYSWSTILVFSAARIQFTTKFNKFADVLRDSMDNKIIVGLVMVAVKLAVIVEETIVLHAEETEYLLLTVDV